MNNRIHPSKRLESAIRIVLGLLVCGMAFSRMARASLVSNGGFEVTTSGNGQLGYNTNAVGWTTTSYSFLYAPGTADTTGAVGSLGTAFLWGPGDGSPNGLTVSPNGGNFVAADGDYNPGPISQTINGLTPGNPYIVSFYWAGAEADPLNSPTTEQWQVSLGAQTQVTPIINNASEGFTGWMFQSMTFTATGSSEVLSFLAAGTPSGEPPFALLDGVSMNDVPEPSGTLLAGIVLGGAAFGRLRRWVRNKSCGV